MRELHVDEITKAVTEIGLEANFDLGEDVSSAFAKFKLKETSEVGKEVLSQLEENADIARDEKLGICQDTGFAVIFLELGQDLHIVGGDLYEAIHEGVRRCYSNGYLRKSIVRDPIDRINTGDNTPAVIHTKIVPGDKLKVTIAPKGGGSENMSGVAMLKPADGLEGVVNFIVNRVSEAGPNPCPPIVVGVGIGGTFEKAALLAKEALLRPIGESHPDPETDRLEKEVLNKINALGIGPAGLGGRTTALDVHINRHPCHIASLPVAVNINCHASRHRHVIL